MGLVYPYVSTGQKVYREGAEYGSARFGNSRERKAFISKNPFNDTILSRNVRLTLLEKKAHSLTETRTLWSLVGLVAGRPFGLSNPI